MNTDKNSLNERLFKRIYPELDLLRSVAIMLVMLMHFVRRVYILPPDNWLRHFGSWGWNGVGLFFVLSGFLIGGQIIEEARHGTFSFKKFYIKRFYRIFPPYYFSLLVVTVLFFTGLADIHVFGAGTDTKVLLTDLTYHIFYLQNYLSLQSLQGGLYWTLATEEQFYILIPVILFFLLKYARGWFLRVIVALIVVAILIRFAHYTQVLPYFPSTSEWTIGIRFPLHTRFDSLLSGVLVAWLFIRYNESLRRIPTMLRVLFILAPIAAIGLSIVYGDTSDSYFNTCWQFTLVNFGFSALILLLITSSFSKYIRGVFKSFFSHIARLSYTMYLYHLILLLPVAKLLSRLDPTGSISSIKCLIFFGIYFLLVAALSSIVYRIIDAPSMKYRSKVVSRMDD